MSNDNEPEVPVEASGDRRHTPQDRRVAVLEMQLRHQIEVHSVDSGDEGQRHEDGRKNGQES